MAYSLFSFLGFLFFVTLPYFGLYFFASLDFKPHLLLGVSLFSWPCPLLGLLHLFCSPNKLLMCMHPKPSQALLLLKNIISCTTKICPFPQSLISVYIEYSEGGKYFFLARCLSVEASKILLCVTLICNVLVVWSEPQEEECEMFSSRKCDKIWNKEYVELL